MKRVVVLVCVVALTVGFAIQGATAGTRGGSSVGRLHLTAASGGGDGTLGVAAATALRQGYLVPDQAAYEAAKAAAAARAGSATKTAAVGSAAPTKVLSWNGLVNPGLTPSDSTGAIGTTRYIETVNSKVGIYARTGALINSNTLDNWWDEVGNFNFDPQVMWDARTNRFYYAGDSVASDTDNRLAYGFSKSASPSNATTDWCHYQVGYVADFPDYPKLGDSAYFALIGVNVFTGPSFSGSDIVAIGKPVGTASITTCPDGATFKFGIGPDIKMAGGVTPAFTPVPATEIDSNPVGYVVARSGTLPATALTIFRVTKDAITGLPVIATTGANVTVPSYTIPADAPQSGTTRKLDTSDSRPTQAIAAVDPLRGSVLALWTQHTVNGGAGARVRWYEINASTRVVLQTGVVSSATLFNFNGAISPDRAVVGATKAFGGNMVLGFNTSSSATFPAIKMVSKLGAAAQSAPVTVKNSPGYDVDFNCPLATDTCRWGDYSAATPDPIASVLGATGVVWLTNMWNANGSLIDPTTGTAWRTWNWSATP